MQDMLNSTIKAQEVPKKQKKKCRKLSKVIFFKCQKRAKGGGRRIHRIGATIRTLWKI